MYYSIKQLAICSNVRPFDLVIITTNNKISDRVTNKYSHEIDNFTLLNRVKILVYLKKIIFSIFFLVDAWNNKKR